MSLFFTIFVGNLGTMEKGLELLKYLGLPFRHAFLFLKTLEICCCVRVTII